MADALPTGQKRPAANHLYNYARPDQAMDLARIGHMTPPFMGRLPEKSLLNDQYAVGFLITWVTHKT
jgi:hypothetical protein